MPLQAEKKKLFQCLALIGALLVASQLLGYRLAFSGQATKEARKVAVLSASQAQRLAGGQKRGGGTANARAPAVLLLHLKGPHLSEGTRPIELDFGSRGAAEGLVRQLQGACVFNKLSGLRLSRSTVHGFTGVELAVGASLGGEPLSRRLDGRLSAGDVLFGGDGRLLICTGDSESMDPSQGWQIVGRVRHGLDTLQQLFSQYDSVEVQDCTEP